ncbi:MAG: transposase [Chloroflexota bacterium]
MSKLPKFDVCGHVHFVTTKVSRFVPLFVVHDFCQILLANVDFYRSKHDFKLLGYVIIPDHFHALIYPQHHVPIRTVLQDIKRYAAKQILERLGEHPRNWDGLGGLIAPPERLELVCQTPARHCLQNLHVPRLADFRVVRPRTTGQEHQVWQEGFYDFNVHTEAKLHEKLNYMHNNPVVWGLVDGPADYPYSSYQNYFSTGDHVPPIETDWL